VIGTVIKSTGSWYSVMMDEDHEVLQCRIIGKFRLNGLKVTNPVAVGDKVVIERESEGGLIKEILDRKNYVVRQSPRKKHQLHLLASNVDQAFLIITIVSPKLKQGFIDRFLLMTEPYNIPVDIIFNKSDLMEDKDMEMYEYLKDIYEGVGYTVHLVSSLDTTTLVDIKQSLEGKVTLISGQSGVGKSTFVNTILGRDDIRTTELSEYTGKGQHTTTFAEMLFINETSFIIDTPGIKSLSFNHLEPMDVGHNFREFFNVSTHCKFADCSHRDEPKCAVKVAIEKYEISELRYFNYLQILEEVEDQNYWERNSNS